MGPLQLVEGAAIDEDRFPDQRGIGVAGAVAIGLAHEVRMGTAETASQEGGDIGHLPGQQILADNEGGLGVVDHGSEFRPPLPVAS